MGCLLVLIGALVPRALIVFIWLLTNWFGRAFDTVIWPVLGFIFMPYTTLVYMAAMLNAGQVTGGYLILLIVAIVVDIAGWGGGGHTYRGRRRAA